MLNENKHGLIVQVCVREAIKRREREAAFAIMAKLRPRDGPMTLAADTGYQECKFIEGVRELGVIPLVAEYKPSKHWPNCEENSVRCGNSPLNKV